MNKNSHIVLLSMGGTISMTSGNRGGVEPSLDGNDLLLKIPAATELARISTQNISLSAGANLTFNDIDALVHVIRRHVNEGINGVVITQGTDTMEESAFALDIRLNVDIPVVVTGSMRTTDAAGSDAEANLMDAICVAGCPHARQQGVLVLMNETIHSARFVQKVHASNVTAFTSAPFGPLGLVSEGRVRFVSETKYFKQIHDKPSAGENNARVALLTPTMDDSVDLLESVTELGYDGLIIAGMGGGHVPKSWVPPLKSIAAGMPVVLSSRTRAGFVLTQTYANSGSEMELIDLGLISSGYLDPLKARVLLNYLLQTGRKTDDIRSCFSQFEYLGDCE